MVLSRPETLGRNAIAMSIPPMQYPTLRAALPVIWTKEGVPGLMTFGTAPATPANRLATPAPERAPCTSRKSIARGSRHETRCRAMEAPFTWMDMTTPRNRNAGRCVQKATPKSNPSPGQSVGTPTQDAWTTASAS